MLSCYVGAFRDASTSQINWTWWDAVTASLWCLFMKVVPLVRFFTTRLIHAVLFFGSCLLFFFFWNVLEGLPSKNFLWQGMVVCWLNPRSLQVVTSPSLPGSHDGSRSADDLLYRRHWWHCRPDGTKENESAGRWLLFVLLQESEEVLNDLSRVLLWRCESLKPETCISSSVFLSPGVVGH